MASITVTGRDYLRDSSHVNGQGPFTYRYLAEGDSWMDRSTAVSGSLPEYLAREMGRRQRSSLIINISTAGHTLRRITDVMDGEFAWWLQQEPFQAILFSAGGNDFIDAAGKPDPGQGLLRNMSGQPLPADGYDCVNHQAIATLIGQFLNPNFDTIYKAIRSSEKNAATPIFLNGYDTPTARNAPAVRGLSGPWLYKAYRKNHIDETLWPSLTAGLFRDIQRTIEGWCVGRIGVHAVPTSGILTPVNPGTPGNRGDWANEIHPNKSGWKKQSKVWADELLSQLV